MRKVAVMGDYDSIYGFSALGIDVYPGTDTQIAEKTLRQLAAGNYAIIYITEALAADIAPEIEKYNEMQTPAIIQIPGISGNTGNGVTGVKNFVEQAIGSDILFGDE